MAQRLVYAPEVQAYIEGPNGVVNITKDIISGSMTRRTDAISTASLVLQNTRGRYSGLFRPMDKIVIYLKKVKPILAFSGYLDTVPYLTAKPGPAQIEASCTLKLLEFTYFDPILPYVQALMAEYVGAGDRFSVTPQLGGDSPFLFSENRFMGIEDGEVALKETGFGRMIHFLVSQAGKWEPERVHIMPIPEEWVETSMALYARIQEADAPGRADAAEIVKRLLTTSVKSVSVGASSAAGGDSGTSSGDGSVSSEGVSDGVVINATDEELADAINKWMAARSAPNQVLEGHGAAFVESGRKHKTDPRFVVAMAAFETQLGSYGPARANNNFFGLGGGSNGGQWPTVEAGIEAGFNNLSRPDGYYFAEGRFSIAAIGAKWAPPGINDAQGTNHLWPGNVGKLYAEMGGDANAQNIRWKTEESSSSSGGTQEGDRSGGSQGSSTSSITAVFNGTMLSSEPGTGTAFHRKFPGVSSAFATVLSAVPGITSTPSPNGQYLIIRGPSSKLEQTASILYSGLRGWANSVSTRNSRNAGAGTADRWGFGLPNNESRTVDFRGARWRYILSFKKHTQNPEIHLQQVREQVYHKPKDDDDTITVNFSMATSQPSTSQSGTNTSSNNTGSPSVSGSNSGSGSGSGSSANDPDSGSATNSGSGGASSSGTKFSVYIEAGHTTPRQPGYVGQTGAAGNPSEIVRNTALAEKIVGHLRGHPKINLITPNGSSPSGAPDIYVSIHYDSGSLDAIAHVSSASYATAEGITNRGKGEPHRYTAGNGGTGGWTDPPRRDIHQNETLIKDSRALAEAVAAKTGQSLTTSARAANYYGFYYSMAKACILIENGNNNNPPHLGSGWSGPDRASAIAAGIIDYVENGGPSGGPGGGDDSPAAKLIEVCLRTAKSNNNGAGGGHLGYSMENRNPGIPLIKAQEQSLTMDCSSYLANGMIEIGAIPEGTSMSTATFVQQASQGPITDKSDLKPGMFLNSDRDAIAGGSVHILLYCGNDTLVHCGGSGPQILKMSATQYNNVEKYSGYVHPKVGTTDTPPDGSNSSASSGTTGSGGSIDILTPAGALNAVFNFPGDTITSLQLRGARAIENDVKLLKVVSEVCEASLRTFASHPNGDFMAWFPDYFNVSGKSPYLVISDNELIDCNIQLSDTNLATHVFVTADINGYEAHGAGSPDIMLKTLTGSHGIVSLEQKYILDTFLRPMEDRKGMLQALSKSVTPANQAQSPPEAGDGNTEQSTEERTRQTSDAAPAETAREGEVDIRDRGIDEFLSRYGARPFAMNLPVLRHPYMVFFITYQWFQRKWAEQFQSNVQMTFMPELFPGTIVGIESMNVNLYCDEVTHSFDYTSGFTTTASLMAPSAGTSLAGSSPLGMALADPHTVRDSESSTEDDGEPDQSERDSILTWKKWLKREKLKPTKANKKRYDEYVITNSFRGLW